MPAAAIECRCGDTSWHNGAQRDSQTTRLLPMFASRRHEHLNQNSHRHTFATRSTLDRLQSSALTNQLQASAAGRVAHELEQRANSVMESLVEPEQESLLRNNVEADTETRTRTRKKQRLPPAG
jgi:hypothetical protein